MSLLCANQTVTISVVYTMMREDERTSFLMYWAISWNRVRKAFFSLLNDILPSQCATCPSPPLLRGLVMYCRTFTKQIPYQLRWPLVAYPPSGPDQQKRNCIRANPGSPCPQTWSGLCLVSNFASCQVCREGQLTLQLFPLLGRHVGNEWDSSIRTVEE